MKAGIYLPGAFETLMPGAPEKVKHPVMKELFNKKCPS